MDVNNFTEPDHSGLTAEIASVCAYEEESKNSGR